MTFPSKCPSCFHPDPKVISEDKHGKITCEYCIPDDFDDEEDQLENGDEFMRGELDTAVW